MVSVVCSDKTHVPYVDIICKTIEEGAKARGIGIGKRDPLKVKEAIEKGEGVIALDGDRFAGFCYMELFGNYLIHTGLIVHPDYRGTGLGNRIKEFIFDLSRKKYPDFKIFGITTSLQVMKMNSKLGYKPVTFSELSQDKKFWDKCKGCCNYETLKSKEFKMCFCTGLLYDPAKDTKTANN